MVQTCPEEGQGMSQWKDAEVGSARQEVESKTKEDRSGLERDSGQK